MSRVTGKTMGLVALLLFCVVPIFAQQVLLPEDVPLTSMPMPLLLNTFVHSYFL